jgi:Family of unknown function (DUF6152)
LRIGFKILEKQMNTFLKVAGAVAVMGGVLTGADMAAAHHSASMFDASKTITLTGTIAEVRWTNPHVTLLVDGKAEEAEQPTKWLIEMTSPSNLVRVSGWTRTSVKPGDNVKIQMSPLRETDKKGGSLKALTLIDTGQSFSPNIREREEPGLE